GISLLRTRCGRCCTVGGRGHVGYRCRGGPGLDGEDKNQECENEAQQRPRRYFLTRLTRKAPLFYGARQHPPWLVIPFLFAPALLVQHEAMVLGKIFTDFAISFLPHAI